MNGFICALCGKEKYIRAGNSLSSYCKECWNDYNREKYQAGGKLGVKEYREIRKVNGLPTPEKNPTAGRKLKSAIDWKCPLCKGGNQAKGLGFCAECRYNWGLWVLIDLRITPEVFWKIQSTTIGLPMTYMGRGLLGKPPPEQQRIIPQAVKDFLSNTSPADLRSLKKEYQQETGGA